MADIGAGSGWFTVRAARRVGGREWCMRWISIRRRSYIDERARKEQLQNVKTILSKPDDPQLPAGSVDAVLMLKTYHEVAQPVTLLKHLRRRCGRERRWGLLTATGTARITESARCRDSRGEGGGI